MEQLTRPQVFAMLEQGELSASLWYPRHTLLALCELAAQAKGVHDPLSRWRLKRFQAVLEGMEGNDEVEVTGETLCETLMLAMGALERR